MAWVATAVAGTALVTSYIGGRKAEDAAYASGKADKAALLATAEEQKRKLILQNAQEIGSAKAVEGVSNTQTVEGSGYDAVLKAMTEEFNKQISWIDKAASLGVKSSDAAVSSADTTIQNQMYSNFLSTASMFGSSQGWWKK